MIETVSASATVRSMPNKRLEVAVADVELIDAQQVAHDAPGALSSARSSPRYTARTSSDAITS